MAGSLSIAVGDPLSDDIGRLVTALDAYLNGLYGQADFLTPVEELVAAGALFLVARLDGRVVGCAALVPEDGYAELKRMYVDPAARGHGIGSALLTDLEQRARAMAFPLFRLEAGEAQTEAVRLYERHGFVRRGPFGGYSFGDALYMEKRLG